MKDPAGPPVKYVTSDLPSRGSLRTADGYRHSNDVSDACQIPAAPDRGRSEMESLACARVRARGMRPPIVVVHHPEPGPTAMTIARGRVSLEPGRLSLACAREKLVGVERGRVAVSSRGGHLLELRSHEPGRCALLRLVRGAARRGSTASRSQEDSHCLLLRRVGLDRARRADRPGEPARRDGALLRGREDDPRAARWNGREVHRRRGDGRLRRAGGARG